jgi:cytoskeletal protein RodZ
MDEMRKLEAKSLAHAKSRSRRRRVAVIRSRTIRGSLALFAVLWGIVFVQLASGNDPTLSRKSQVEKSSASVAREPTPAEPVREPAPEAEAELDSAEPEFEEEAAPEFEELEPEPEFEAEAVPAEETAPEIEEPIVTSSS